ncbi:MAG: hypothetical protein QOI95_767 [Acidimicrobiaceae bacterium]|jgi:hypothetical protein
MMIEPDTKDWTWVLERACFDCGFDAAAVQRDRVGALLRDNVALWPPLLSHARANARPNDHTWSATEYACHVRDVFKVFDGRLQLMLAEDGAAFPNWDQDATAIEDDYASQDPANVANDLAVAGTALATRFDSVPDDAWSRKGVRSDGAHFTLGSFATYLLHDPTHHIWDVEQGYATLDEAAAT